jgi:APA family basic amino acid/polyamine antiporter
VSPRIIGTGGAVATIVGFVIGVSVFVLPGSLAVQTGPAVVVSYGIAALLGGFACIAGAQVGVAYPQSGASFLAVSDLLGPFWGFLLVWLLVGASAVGIGLLAYGLADYLGSIVTVNRAVIAALAIVFFAFVNVVGVRASTGIQSALVVVFLAALLLFVAAGAAHIEVDNLRPFLPNGWPPVLLAVLPAYFSFAGFLVIVELAGEIRSPERTIPAALLLGFLLVLATYALVSLTLVGVVPWRELAGDSAPIGTAAARVLPGPLASVITFTAVAAAASSINGILLGYSRDVKALAARGLFPSGWLLRARWMARDSAGVLPIAAVALLAVAWGPAIDRLAVQTVVGVLLVQCLLGVALLRLPRVRPERWRRLPFRMPLPLLRFCAGGLVVTSAGACAAIVATGPAQVVVAFLYCGAGYGIYRLQAGRAQKGINPVEG